ncbi:hypothetical protein QCA50_007708 [Cerrena zonata]|uniref:Uncharacterized protein n=1 Tax=Cerrena zonata TaxID=2478898 RepID=A0AAW0G9B3_9APHY
MKLYASLLETVATALTFWLLNNFTIGWTNPISLLVPGRTLCVSGYNAMSFNIEEYDIVTSQGHAYLRAHTSIPSIKVAPMDVLKHHKQFIDVAIKLLYRSNVVVYEKYSVDDACVILRLS